MASQHGKHHQCHDCTQQRCYITCALFQRSASSAGHLSVVTYLVSIKKLVDVVDNNGVKRELVDVVDNNGVKRELVDVVANDGVKRELVDVVANDGVKRELVDVVDNNGVKKELVDVVANNGMKIKEPYMCIPDDTSSIFVLQKLLVRATTVRTRDQWR